MWPSCPLFIRRKISSLVEVCNRYIWITYPLKYLPPHGVHEGDEESLTCWRSMSSVIATSCGFMRRSKTVTWRLLGTKHVKPCDVNDVNFFTTDGFMGLNQIEHRATKSVSVLRWESCRDWVTVWKWFLLIKKTNIVFVFQLHYLCAQMLIGMNIWAHEKTLIKPEIYNQN